MALIKEIRKSVGKWVKRERKEGATGVTLEDSFGILYCGNSPIAPRRNLREKEMEGA